MLEIKVGLQFHLFNFSSEAYELGKVPIESNNGLDQRRHIFIFWRISHGAAYGIGPRRSQKFLIHGVRTFKKSFFGGIDDTLPLSRGAYFPTSETTFEASPGIGFARFAKHPPGNLSGIPRRWHLKILRKDFFMATTMNTLDTSIEDQRSAHNVLWILGSVLLLTVLAYYIVRNNTAGNTSAAPTNRASISNQGGTGPMSGTIGTTSATGANMGTSSATMGTLGTGASSAHREGADPGINPDTTGSESGLPTRDKTGNLNDTTTSPTE
jgi:hypothetical protein